MSVSADIEDTVIIFFFSHAMHGCPWWKIPAALQLSLPRFLRAISLEDVLSIDSGAFRQLGHFQSFRDFISYGIIYANCKSGDGSWRKSKSNANGTRRGVSCLLG